MAMLCASGLATMSELLQYDGPWSYLLIQLMLPRAVEIEMKAANMNFNATLAAVGSIFSKDAAQKWQAAMNKTAQSVRAAVGDATGEDVQTQQANETADTFLEMAKKMTGTPAGQREPLGPKGPTRVHRR